MQTTVYFRENCEYTSFAVPTHVQMSCYRLMVTLTWLSQVACAMLASTSTSVHMHTRCKSVFMHVARLSKVWSTKRPCSQKVIWHRRKISGSGMLPWNLSAKTKLWLELYRIILKSILTGFRNFEKRPITSILVLNVSIDYICRAYNYEVVSPHNFQFTSSETCTSKHKHNQL